MNAEKRVNSETITADLNDCILLGKVVGVWGVKGWLKIFSYTRPRQDIGQYKTWLLVSPSISNKASAEAVVASIKHCKEQGKNIVAKVQGVEYRDQAEACQGLQIYIDKAQLQPLPDGEFYWSDMLRCEVENTTGEDLGIVDSIIETGANDVLVVHQRTEKAVYERLIPYSVETVLSLDKATKKIVVNWDKDYLVTEKPL